MWPNTPLQARLKIAWGADTSADPSTWDFVDETAYWHVPADVRIKWGGSYRSGQPESAEFEIWVKNTTGRFTTRDARSPLWPLVVPDTPILFEVSFDDGVTWWQRFAGKIRKLPTTWPGRSARQALARITAHGILYDLQRGEPPTESALRRTELGVGAVALWPCEDGAAAGQAASAIPNHPAAKLTGVVQFVTPEDVELPTLTVRYGTSALADLSGGGMISARVPADVTEATAAGWTAQVTTSIDTFALSDSPVLIEVDTPGATYAKWQLVIDISDSNTWLRGVAADGTTTIEASLGSVAISFAVHDISVWQDGGTIRVGIQSNSTTTDSYSATGSVAGTLTGVTAIRTNPTRVTRSDPWPVGHLGLYARHPNPLPDSKGDSYGGSAASPLQSLNREVAHVRLVRLAAENGLTVSLSETPELGEEVRMGWQAPGTPLGLYGQCVAADGGLLREDGFGLAYDPRIALYNRPVLLTIDASQRQLRGDFQPDDELQFVNDWTIERIDGSSASASDEEHAARAGRVRGSLRLNLNSDLGLGGRGSWELSRTMWPEPGFPVIGFDLHTSPELLDGWLQCREGSRIQVINPPEQHPQEPIDQIIVGAEEVYSGRRKVSVSMVTAPAGPWDVGAWNDAGPVLYDFDSTSQGWAGETGVAVARVTDPVHDGAGALQATKTMSGGFDSIRFNDAGGQPDDLSGGGPMLAMWALVPVGAAGTDWAAHIEVQDSTFTWQPGPNAPLTPGTWEMLTWEPPAALLADSRAIGVQFEAVDVGGSQAVYVDTVKSAAPQSSRWSSSYSTLASAFVAGTDTTLSLATEAGRKLWTTKPASFPFDLDVGGVGRARGVRVRATAISGASSPQTVTVSTSVLVEKTFAADTPVRIWKPGRWAL